MDLFRTYLTETKKNLVSTEEPVRIVLGNTSGDMDSIVGALGLAYFYQCRSGQKWTPIISCDRQDFKLRCEIFKHLCEDCKIDENDLIFWDEFMSLNRSIEEIALIDHNRIDPIQFEQLGPDCSSKVTHIIDHHVDLKAYPAEQLKESVIKFIGSACSVSTLQMAAQKEVFPEGTWSQTDVKADSFAYFYAAAVSLDTYNFKESLRNGKWQADDEEAWMFLKEYYPFTDDYFGDLSAAKFDQERALSFGFRGVMTRDYKNYHLKGTVNGEAIEGRMGISVSVNPIKKVFERFGDDMCFDMIDAYMDEKNLDVYGVNCSVHNEDHSVSRYCMMYSRAPNALSKALPFLIEEVDKNEILQATDKEMGKRGEDGLYCFWQFKNSSVSRKKLEAFLRKVLAC